MRVSPTVSEAPTCTLSSSSVQISGSAGAAQPVTVTVGTTARVTTGIVSQVNFTPGAIAMTGTVILLVSLWLRNRKRLPSLAAPLIVLALASWLGCGGGGSSSQTTTPGTAAGTYTAAITATSGSLKQNRTLTVVVE